MNTEWKDVTTLRKIDVDISNGYVLRKYAASRQFLDRYRISSSRPANVGKCLNRDRSKDDGAISQADIDALLLTDSDDDLLCFDNPYEVMKKDGEILYREPDTKNRDREPPEFFDTQFGRFENCNEGEFGGHAQKGSHKINGNFVEMFDFGDYVYAVSNLMHMGLGGFTLKQIDKRIQTKTLFSTRSFLHPEGSECFQYLGKYMDPDNVKIYLSGYETPREGKRRDKSKILQIEKDGSFAVIGDYDYAFGWANSVVPAKDFLYLGMNHMVTLLDLKTGEREYFTAQPQEDIDEMMKHKRW